MKSLILFACCCLDPVMTSQAFPVDGSTSAYVAGIRFGCEINFQDWAAAGGYTYYRLRMRATWNAFPEDLIGGWVSVPVAVQLNNSGDFWADYVGYVNPGTSGRWYNCYAWVEFGNYYSDTDTIEYEDWIPIDGMYIDTPVNVFVPAPPPGGGC